MKLVYLATNTSIELKYIENKDESIANLNLKK